MLILNLSRRRTRLYEFQAKIGGHAVGHLRAIHLSVHLFTHRNSEIFYDEFDIDSIQVQNMYLCSILQGEKDGPKEVVREELHNRNAPHNMIIPSFLWEI